MNIVSKMSSLTLLPPNTTIHIRALQPDDLPALLAGCWQERPKETAETTFHHLIAGAAEQRDLGFVIVDNTENGSLVGFGRLTVWLSYAEISDLIVLPARRSQGLGTAMIQHLVQVALTMNLEFVEIGAATSNPRALALYLRLGFQKALARQLNLGHGEEIVQYMRLHFPKAT